MRRFLKVNKRGFSHSLFSTFLQRCVKIIRDIAAVMLFTLLNVLSLRNVEDF